MHSHLNCHDGSETSLESVMILYPCNYRLENDTDIAQVTWSMDHENRISLNYATGVENILLFSNEVNLIK